MTRTTFRTFPAIIALFLLSGGVLLSQSAHAEKARTAGEPSISETYRALDLFGDVFEQARTNYVDEIEDKKLIENALNGMLTNLDPHSAYMTEKETKSMSIHNRGEFGGLGIEVTMENGLVKVVSPIDDTPADRAGMQAGDLIVEIDDQAVMGMTLSEAVENMRGKVGSEIKLTVVRDGEKEPLTVRIVRDVIRIQSTKWRVESDNIGYIRITAFNGQTTKGLKKAFREIKKESGDKLIGYVLDLRNNPGGLLDEAISVSDAFLEQGEIVSTRGRNPDDTRRDNATPGDLAEDLPVVVLINEGSASASEIVAGALQDHRRGIVMGTQSFGKGSVQTIFNVPGGGAIRLTTARYYTPSGRSIQAKGIEPDIIVERAKVVAEKKNRFRIKEKDLKGALDKQNGDDDKKEKTRPTLMSDKKADKKGDKDKVTDDYQLLRAVDLLQGISLYGSVQNQPALKPANDDTPAVDNENASGE